MKTFRLYVWVSLSLLAAGLLLSAQPARASKLAVLPFTAIGINDVSTQSAESILRLEIGRLSPMDMVSEKKTWDTAREACADVECAADIGKKLDADQVVTCRLAALGDKVIVQFLLVNVHIGKAVLQDQLTAATIEDLETVMKRVASSIVNQIPVEKSAEIGNITETETQIPRRRSARRFGGFSFGYLYPQNGYDNADRSFAMDFRTGAEMQKAAIGMQMAIRKGFAVNIFASYLASPRDFCPYVGGGFGFHWVSHSNAPEYYNDNGQWIYREDKRKGDGFEVVLNTGVLAFHTYNLQLIANLAYTYTINDYDDQAILFTLGLLK